MTFLIFPQGRPPSNSDGRLHLAKRWQMSAFWRSRKLLTPLGGTIKCRLFFLSHDFQ
ncbi:MAG TPA: hypothetical protein VK211_00790 [Kamptonema sp.]|nr:hypothetical protein [Kamptonema sp.]